MIEAKRIQLMLERALPVETERYQFCAAGKIIKSASVQLEYAVACNQVPDIPFLK